jgi:hypothetical protein
LKIIPTNEDYERGKRERDNQWHEYRRQLLEAWAKDWRATMTVLLEEGYPQ